MVFKAYTDPSIIPHWWGRRRLTTMVDKMDVRPGGVWRFVQRGPDGHEYAFNGVYREIVPPERLVQTFEFEGMPGGPPRRIPGEAVSLERRGASGGSKR